MSRLVKAAILGSIVTTVIGIIFSIAANVSFKAFVPFYMPWAVLLLIRFSNRKK
jgi:hypothetical protein